MEGRCSCSWSSFAALLLPAGRGSSGFVAWVSLAGGGSSCFAALVALAVWVESEIASGRKARSCCSLATLEPSSVFHPFLHFQHLVSMTCWPPRVLKEWPSFCRRPVPCSSFEWNSWRR